MEEQHLYRKIAETIRQEILNGQRKPGDRLPTVREMARLWNCTAGTIQHAYKELAQQGLLTSRAGQGTKVAERLPALDETPLRRAMLIHRAEAFLLEVITSGYELEEVDQAVRQAMDRWRSVEQEQSSREENALRFTGSHDMVVTWLASHFPQIAPGHKLILSFSGSLGGLIALAQGNSELAGCHLWDEESDTYNIPFVRRLLPGREVALVTLAYRRLGLILPAGNPDRIHGLDDLTRPGLRFLNRQPGSGTRVWLDIALKKAGIQTDRINGYHDEKITHTAVAQAVAESKADVGIGLEAAALRFGLDFVFLTHDRYDLVVPNEIMETAPMKNLVGWLNQPSTHQIIENLGGYQAHGTGQVSWVS
jgi:molybdate-binding protein/DNA-binding transcriptional regulator YhcF (GntR family)